MPERIGLRDDARAIIAREMKRQGWSQRAIARELAINHSTLSPWLNGKNDSLSADTLFALLRLLNISATRIADTPQTGRAEYVLQRLEALSPEEQEIAIRRLDADIDFLARKERAE